MVVGEKISELASMGAIEWQQALVNYSAEVFNRFLELVKAPVFTPEMLWILSPLLLNLVLMEFYFGRYSEEELGWNTAYGNALVLIFVSLDLLRYLYNHGLLIFGLKIALVITVLFVGVFLTFLDYFHLIPKEFAFVISSKLPINFLALISVLVIYSDLVLDYVSLSAVILLLVVFYIIIKLIHGLTPRAAAEESE